MCFELPHQCVSPTKPAFALLPTNQPGRCPDTWSVAFHFLVVLLPADLLPFAKHLFVAARTVARACSHPGAGRSRYGIKAGATAIVMTVVGGFWQPLPAHGVMWGIAF